MGLLSLLGLQRKPNYEIEDLEYKYLTNYELDKNKAEDELSQFINAYGYKVEDKYKAVNEYKRSKLAYFIMYYAIGNIPEFLIRMIDLYLQCSKSNLGYYTGIPGLELNEEEEIQRSKMKIDPFRVW